MLHDPRKIWAVILAAGSGTRLQETVNGLRKQYIPYKGTPLFFNSVRTFSRVASLGGFIFVFPPDEVEAMRGEVKMLFAEEGTGLPFKVVAGGERRQDSVRNGLKALPSECGTVLVHDGARPFASAKLFQNLLDELEKGRENGVEGVIPVLPLKDTVKKVNAQNIIQDTLVRSELRLVQTPQAFVRSTLDKAHALAEEEGFAVTDDASMVEHIAKVGTVAGEEENVKITTPADLQLVTTERPMLPVVGFGYDVHKFGEGRPMVLGGVPIQGGPQIVAHSDGDVLLHALMDAMLGCMAQGDIGQHFPDSDDKYDNISSALLLKEVLLEAEKAEVTFVHVDMTVISQIPKLAPWRQQIERNVARMMGLGEHQVNFKATTEEKLGFTGRKQGIKAQAAVTAMRKG
ncbi:MAG: 2-C-methyl-D-erythritol 4-phosphate cytidylyltransferase [Desulfovibrio sp.]